MSRSEWEEGTLTIPTKAWKAFRDGMAEAFNKRQAKLYAAAVKMKASLDATKKAQPRGKFDLRQEFSKLCQSPAYREVFEGDPDMEQMGELARALTGKRYWEWDAKTKLKTPLKKDFPLAVSTKTTYYAAGCEAGVTLNHAKRTANWSVGQNNHAVEHAREAPMGKVFFTLLSRIEWTRGSGGEIVGNDEYNRDNRHSGGGGNYVTATYAYKSPKEKAEEARQARQFRSSGFGAGFGYGYGYGRR